VLVTTLDEGDRPITVPVRVVPPAPESVAGTASRLARSMMGLVVGAPRLPAAEKVAEVGVSIAEFVGAPVRRMLEPAIDNRSDAAQEAMYSLIELTRVVIQEAIELVDLNAILERIDLNALMGRVDLNQLLQRVDVDEMLERVDVDEIIKRVDVADILRRVDVNALMERVDVNELMARVDIEAMLGRVDINQMMETIDIDGIVERTELGSLVVRSTSGVATEALDAVRSRAVGIDTTIARIVDRVLRRKPGPPGPGLLAPDATA
jgi:hypothetical protein